MNYGKSLAVVFALASASVAVAQSTPAPGPDEGAKIQNSDTQVTGTVITSEANRLIVKADNGQQMVFIVNETTAEPRMFRAGDRVTASYVTLAGTGTVVSRVVTAPALTTTTSTTYAPSASATTRTETYPVNPSPAPAPAMNTTTTVAPTDRTTRYGADDQQTVATLPATASPMPLVALFGLLAAGGAATIRRFRKS